MCRTYERAKGCWVQASRSWRRACTDNSAYRRKGEAVLIDSARELDGHLVVLEKWRRLGGCHGLYICASSFIVNPFDTPGRLHPGTKTYKISQRTSKFMNP